MFRNTDVSERRYDGLVFQGRYRARRRWSVYGNCTVQLKNEGNFEGEATNQPGVSSTFGDYPEVFTEARHFPVGRLAAFQRHKLRLWTTYALGLRHVRQRRRRAGRTATTRRSRYSLRADGAAAHRDSGSAARRLREHAPARRTSTSAGAAPSSFDNGSHLFDLALTYSLPVLQTLKPYLKLDMRNVFNTQAADRLRHDDRSRTSTVRSTRSACRRRSRAGRTSVRRPATTTTRCRASSACRSGSGSEKELHRRG